MRAHLIAESRGRTTAKPAEREGETPQAAGSPRLVRFRRGAAVSTRQRRRLHQESVAAGWLQRRHGTKIRAPRAGNTR